MSKSNQLIHAEAHAAGMAAVEKLEVVPMVVGSTYKMLVQDDRGFKVWGTVPGSIAADKGDEIKFVANVEASDDDPKFGFFKRPRKAVTLKSGSPDAGEDPTHD